VQIPERDRSATRLGDPTSSVSDVGFGSNNICQCTQRSDRHSSSPTVSLIHRSTRTRCNLVSAPSRLDRIVLRLVLTSSRSTPNELGSLSPHLHSDFIVISRPITKATRTFDLVSCILRLLAQNSTPDLPAWSSATERHDRGFGKTPEHHPPVIYHQHQQKASSIIPTELPLK
jgi:hypothetical protein